MLPKKLVFVDIETTGFSVNRDRIIEIGIICVEDNKLVKSYHSVINPEMYLSPTIQGITGITKEELEKSPTFYEIKDVIVEFLEGAVFVAHNVRFDYGFLRNEFKRYGINFTSKHFCTVKLSKYLYPQYPRHSLDEIIARHNIPCVRRHRAYEDAYVLWEFYQILQREFSIEALTTAINLALKKPSLPTNISSEVLQTLPELPGVYLFYGAEGVPLYIGKSINIKERVLSHFANDHTSSTEMKIAQQIESIEAITTSGELGALVKESFLIKKMQPIYNRQLRLAHKLIVLKSKKNSEGYEEAEMVIVDRIAFEGIAAILGVFRSQRQAKTFLITLAKEHSLCERLLHLEKTKTACFAYRLGNCLGACIEKENSLKYNLRFLQAFSKSKIRSWPFTGPILIKEANQLEETVETFIVDKWCLLGSVKNLADGEKAEFTNEYLFDLDTYKILANYLFQPKNTRNITTISPQQLQNLF